MHPHAGANEGVYVMRMHTDAGTYEAYMYAYACLRVRIKACKGSSRAIERMCVCGVWGGSLPLCERNEERAIKLGQRKTERERGSERKRK
jgi:hypothetical protein